MFAHLHLQGTRSCAITDHGVMYGVVDFYREAKAAGIHPVIGCEVYVCPDMDNKTGAGRGNSHLILLCENQTGYKNLSKLVSEGFLRGYYYRPRVDYALLEKYHEGLIALSACLSGDLPKLLLDGREDEARAMAEKYVSIFGRDNFFIELQDLAREDAEAQEVLMCIQTGKTLSDENRMHMKTDQLYVKSEAEMRAAFPNFPDAIERTEEIAQRCQVEFTFRRPICQRFRCPRARRMWAICAGSSRKG